MPTNRTPLSRNRRGLSYLERMSLDFGEDPRRRTFESDDDRRASWIRNREYLLASCRAGRRPQAWWDYESTVPFPDDSEYEAAALYEADLLSEAEKASLMAEWREAFDKAQEPGFSFCVGHAKPGDTFATWLEGADARRAHYHEAGIPAALVREWMKRPPGSPDEAENRPSGHACQPDKAF